MFLVSREFRGYVTKLKSFDMTFGFTKFRYWKKTENLILLANQNISWNQFIVISLVNIKESLSRNFCRNGKLSGNFINMYHTECGDDKNLLFKSIDKNHLLINNLKNPISRKIEKSNNCPIEFVSEFNHMDIIIFQQMLEMVFHEKKSSIPHTSLIKTLFGWTGPFRLQNSCLLHCVTK